MLQQGDFQFVLALYSRDLGEIRSAIGDKEAEKKKNCKYTDRESFSPCLGMLGSMFVWLDINWNKKNYLLFSFKKGENGRMKGENFTSILQVMRSLLIPCISTLVNA